MSQDAISESDQGPLFPFGPNRRSPRRLSSTPSSPTRVTDGYEVRISEAQADLGGGVYAARPSEDTPEISRVEGLPKQRAFKLARQALNAWRESQSEPPIPEGELLPIRVKERPKRLSLRRPRVS